MVLRGENLTYHTIHTRGAEGSWQLPTAICTFCLSIQKSWHPHSERRYEMPMLNPRNEVLVALTVQQRIDIVCKYSSWFRQDV